MERGDPTISIGTLVTALFVLQMHDRFANLADPGNDAIALDLDEQQNLPKRIRRPRRQ
jgi:hypothetical protein